MRAMAVGLFGQAHFLEADLVDHRVDRFQDRGRRAEAGVDRQVAELERQPLPGVGLVFRFAQRRASSRGSSRARVELGRIAALEAVDRLLEVADHEQSPEPSLGFAGAAEKLFDQRA